MKLRDILPLVNQETICLYEVDSTQDYIGYYDLTISSELVVAENFAGREVIYMYPGNEKYSEDTVLNIGLKQEPKNETNEEILNYLNAIDKAMLAPFGYQQQIEEIKEYTDKIRKLLK